MWNVAAVEAALKLNFPRKSDYHVISWDVTLPGTAATDMSTRLFSAADVVVAGVGTGNVHHVLLKDWAAVVDVETRGATWHEVELQPGVVEEVYERLGMTVY